MGSFALWFDSNNSSCDFKADVHFNLWNMHYKKATPTSLDIGIKINNINTSTVINIYIPFEINKSNIIDLGCRLKTSEILCSVFNEDYVVSHTGNDKKVTVTSKEGLPVMRIYCLDISNDIKIETKYDGTVISFECLDELANLNIPIYFRLRITSYNFRQIIKPYKPHNIFLQSAISIIEAIDFRFNDYRSLNSSLLEEMRNSISYKIGKVHFLLLTEADVDLQYSLAGVTARELENKVWNGYFDNIFNKNIVAYHWRFSSETSNKLIENCIMFVKTKVYRCNIKTIIIYILILGVLTVLFNYISHLLF